MEVIVLGALIFLTLLMFVVGFVYTRNQNQVKARVNSLNTETASKVLSGRQKSLDDSFVQRVIVPLAQTISDKIQFVVPLSGKSWIRQKLVQAGYFKTQYVQTFMGIHCMTTIGFPLVITILPAILTRSGFTVMTVLMTLFLGFLGFFIPVFVLYLKASNRQMSIRRSLPDFIDLLVVCVEAGLGLDIAISKISRTESVQTSEYLKEELIRYTKDVGLGKPRKDALMDLANRTGVDDLNVVVNALIQSYEMGTGVVQALKVQSDGLRQKRLHRAEAAANKIAVKMVLPIYIFFFPGIFIVALGPMILLAVERIGQAMQHTPPGM